MLHVQDPFLYKGQLAKNAAQVNTDKIFIVNGMVEKVDANFNRGFNVTKVDKTGIFMGPCPLDDQDVSELVALGIGGVVNLQTAD